MSATAKVDSRAVISERARLAPGVQVGAYAVVGDDVELGENCVLHPHAVVRGPARYGRENVFHSFCSIGGDPQDLKYHGERTTLEVGDRNAFRESVTVNRGTAKGGGVTRIGSDNLFMTGAHIAHDCTVGNHTIFANAATLAGHVIVEDYVTVGAFSAVHQFCRVGRYAYIGGFTVVTQDVPPFARGRTSAKPTATASTASASSATAFRASASTPSSAPIACCCARNSTPRRPSSRCAPN